MYSKTDPKTIESMFGSIAPKYDRANLILSLGQHRRWTRCFVEKMSQGSVGPWLDLCAGTGDVAFEWLRRSPAAAEIHLMDFCEDMLAHAQEKAASLPFHHHDISYRQGDVHDLPYEEAMMSRVTLAFGPRNLADPEKCFREVFRVLRGGGRFGILELTRPPSKLLAAGHRLWLRNILPILGRIITANGDAYRYLSKSIHTFCSPEELSGTLKKIGFSHVTSQPLCGGIATMIIGNKE